MIKRRYFFIGAVCALAAWRLGQSSEPGAIVAVLRKRLDYLRLEPRGLALFAREFAARHVVSSGRLKLVSALEPLYRRVPSGRHDAFGNTLRNGEERIVSSYLLSSDFFANGADPSREVRFTGMYDPLTGCANPLARPMT